MNDLFLAQDIAAVLADPAGPYELSAAFASIVAALDATDIARPTLTIGGTFSHFGPAHRMGTLTFDIRSRVGDATNDLEHQQRGQAVWTALLGATGESVAESRSLRVLAHSALISAVAARNRVTILSFGPSPEPIEESIDGEDLRTVLKISVAWQLI